METVAQKPLTCTSSERTLYAVFRTVKEMDATAKKLADAMADTQRQIAALQRKANALSAALEEIGLRIEDADPFSLPSDAQYADDRPFVHSSLVAACKRILRDHKGRSLNKSQVEYLAAIGGYPFATEDSKNSVDVTLRRLAESGFCEVEKAREGNKYFCREQESPKDSPAE